MTDALKVAQPLSGESHSYVLTPGVPVRFDFDMSEAAFAAVGNDLIISCPEGGSVVLREYLTLASDDSLPVFEMSDGERIPGEYYLFAFESGDRPDQDLETRANDAPQGSGSGEYADDPGALGHGLDAVGGQGDAFSPHNAPTLFQGLSPLETETGGSNGDDIGAPPLFADDIDVQIVINPGFETSGVEGLKWLYLDESGDWRNLGEEGEGGGIGPHYKPVMAEDREHPGGGDEDMNIWDMGMDQRPEEGDGLAQLDARPGVEDTLTQAVATQAGEEITVSFSFTPRMDHDGGGPAPDSNDFEVTLGDRLVAAVTWDADHDNGSWLVTLGQDVTTANGSDLDFHFSNSGYVPGSGEAATDWTRLSFCLTADQDHAELSFREYADHDDGYGTLLDSVSVVRAFHTYTVGESQEGTEFLAGTGGDDALFGSPRDVVDGTDSNASFAEILVGGDGDDALYGGRNFLTVLSGGDGDDFMVAARPMISGMEESQDMGTGVGMNLLLPGSGDDYIRLGDGDDAIILNREALVDGDTLTVEGFAPGSPGHPGDQLFLADGLSVLHPPSFDGEALHLFVGDPGAAIEICMLGLHPLSLDQFVFTGPEADQLDAQVQELINSGGGTLA